MIKDVALFKVLLYFQFEMDENMQPGRHACALRGEPLSRGSDQDHAAAGAAASKTQHFRADSRFYDERCDF